MKLEDRMLKSIHRKNGNVILRSDVANLGSDSQVSEALRSLQEKKELVRIAIGVYAKAHPDPKSGSARVGADLRTLTSEALRRLCKSATLEQWKMLHDNDRHCWVAYVSKSEHRFNRKFHLGDQFVWLTTTSTAPQPTSHCDESNSLASHWPNEHSKNKTTRHYILTLARKHDVSYQHTLQDRWANTITQLAGDDVIRDPVKDLLVALKRAGKVSTDEMANLLIRYLREKKNV
jgi:hypothetical protein